MVQRIEHRCLFWQWKLTHAQRNTLRNQTELIAAATRQILRRSATCRQRHNSPLPIADRIYRVVRWTKQGSLVWLLLCLLVCTSGVRAQIDSFDRQTVEIFGTVFAETGNRPVEGAIVNIRLDTGGTFVSVLTDWSGRFRVQRLEPGAYEIFVEEPNYEPAHVTLQLPRGPSPPLELSLKSSNRSLVRRTDYAISVRELKIPMQARNAFEKGLQRLAKQDAAGSLTQFARATAGFPDYYEAYYHIGVADLRLGREEEAAQAFQRAIDLSGGRYAWAQFALGLVLYRRGEYAEAETVIRQGLNQDENSAIGHLLLSLALFRESRLDEAEKSAGDALWRKSGFALPYLVLADIHGRRGEYARELQNLDAYLKLEPNGPASKRVREIHEGVQRIIFRTKAQE